MKITSKLLLLISLCLASASNVYAERIDMKIAGADATGNNAKHNTEFIRAKVEQLEIRVSSCQYQFQLCGCVHD